MAQYNAIKAAVNAYIKANGRKEITGQILNSVLNATIDSLGRFFQFAGEARPDTDPGTPDQNVTYLAGVPGTYTHFNGLVIDEQEIALLMWNGDWVKHTMLIGIREVVASVDDQVGTPSVDVNYDNAELSLAFHNMKGNPGIDGNDGAAAGFGSVTADVDANIGTPGVSVETSGSNTAKNITFHFTNLKGQKGDTGVTSVNASVDNNTGVPSATASLSGGVLTLTFHNLKGVQGDTGSSVDYPYTLANNVTTDDATQGLSAAMGVYLQGEITQLEHEVDGLPAHSENILSVTGNVGSSVLFVANPLLEGDSFTVTLRVVNANWTRFAFSTNNTGTDMGTMKNNGELEFYKTANTVGDRVESGTAPNPSTYPYIAYQKPNSGNSIYVDKNIPQGRGLVDDVQDLETSLQNAENAITGLSNDIDAVEGDVATIESQIDGVPSEELLNTSAIVADMTYADNTLAEDDAFTLQYIIGAANWTRFAFSKVNTGTDWATELGNDNLYFSHQNNEVGNHTWKGHAPDPTVYPYIVYQKASNQNTIKLTKDAVIGLAGRIANIEDGGVVKQSQLSQTSIINDLSGTIASGYNLYLQFEKPLVPGTEYQFTLDFSDETSENILKLAHIYLLSNKANNTQVGDIVSLYDKNTGGEQSFNVTPTDFVVAVNIIFQSTYTITGATLALQTRYTRPTYGDYDRELSIQQSSMVGKTILMLGDSITQIPATGASSLNGLMGMGIVEYSAIKLGANVLRGAVGGSHLARRTTTKPSSVTSDGEARAVLDVPSIVESLVSGDWTLQDAAAVYTGMDASLVGIVDTLKNVDMSQVAAVTIFAGTNDMRADVPLGDADSINPYYVNGAVNYISKIFCEAFPQVQLIFYTPCFRKFSTDWEDDSDYADNYENGIDLTLYDYADAILARARDNNLPACDMLRTMGWNKYNYHAFCNDNDATHPRKGFQHLATRICGFLLEMQNRF